MEKIRNQIAFRLWGLFRAGERTDAPLSELFLPGYYSQRQTLYHNEKGPNPEPFVPETDRSVLFGYLAAVSESVELRTTDDRAGRTNALRMSETLITRPVGTWALLLERTVPYLEKRGADSTFDTKLLRACEVLFPEAVRNDPAPLDSGFLHGYYTMRGAVRTWEPPAAVPVSEPVSDPIPMQRDDAFGLLLAIENHVERFVMDSVQKTEKQNFRLSSAFRYLSVFDHRPWSTWTVLKEKLSPYLHRLPDGGRRKSEKIEQLEALIKENGWDSDTPLSGSCLHQFLL